MAEVRIRCNVGGSGDRPMQSSGRHNVSTVMVGGPEENTSPSSNGHETIPSNNNEDNTVTQTTEILLAPPESE